MTRKFGLRATVAAAALAVGAGMSVLFGGTALAHGWYDFDFDFNEGGAGGDAFVTCTTPVQTITPGTSSGPISAAQCVGIGGDGGAGGFDLDFD